MEERLLHSCKPARTSGVLDTGQHGFLSLQTTIIKYPGHTERAHKQTKLIDDKLLKIHRMSFSSG